MLDILESISKVDKKKREVPKFKCVAFIQSEHCSTIIEEAFRFEGITLPSMVRNTDADMKAHVRQSDIEIAIVELTDSVNVTDDMRRISHLLPNDASVIVIGQEDAISTIRNLKEMGFYYLFWPATKTELLDFVKNVHDNRLRDSGLGKKRTAKKIVVWGCCGGAGASILTSEISAGLAQKYYSKCLSVDHDFYSGNIDILHHIEGFEKKTATIENVGQELDATYASSLTRKVDDMLSILSLTSEEHTTQELKEFTRSLEALLYEQNNFVISDLSKGDQTDADYKYLGSNVDTSVLVFNPSVSSVRQLKKLLNFLAKRKSKSRLILVMNHVQPAKVSQITKSEIEEFLQRHIDIEIPFEQDLPAYILKGGYLFQSRLTVAKPINNLIGMIMGESIQTEKRSIFRRIFKK